MSSTCGRMLTCSWMMKKESVMVSTVAQGTKGQRKMGREKGEREREIEREREREREEENVIREFTVQRM